jgi:hypothetical protein
MAGLATSPKQKEVKVFREARVRFDTIATQVHSCYFGLIEFKLVGILLSKRIKKSFFWEGVLRATASVVSALVNLADEILVRWQGEYEFPASVPDWVD